MGGVGIEEAVTLDYKMAAPEKRSPRPASSRFARQLSRKELAKLLLPPVGFETTIPIVQRWGGNSSFHSSSPPWKLPSCEYESQSTMGLVVP